MTPKMKYGGSRCMPDPWLVRLLTQDLAVRLGNSGLKVSKIILGCMSYGSKGWAEWVIEDQAEVNKHIKYASAQKATLFSASRVRT